MSGYGEVVRETAAQAHERKVEAIEGVLADWLASLNLPPGFVHKLAERCLAAVEAGF